MMHVNPYRAVAELAEPPFETEAYAPMALDEDDEPLPEAGVSSVLMRAEDFTLPDRPDEGTPVWISVTVVALAFAGLMTLCAVVAWIGESFL